MPTPPQSRAKSQLGTAHLQRTSLSIGPWGLRGSCPAPPHRRRRGPGLQLCHPHLGLVVCGMSPSQGKTQRPPVTLLCFYALAN